jgi:hypothetical protein
MEPTATGHWKLMLKKVPDRDLFLLRDQIDEVTQLPGWERIVAFIASGHGGVLRSLTVGPTRSHADYARQIGYLSGLEEAPQVAEAIKEAATERERHNQALIIADERRREGSQ